MGKRKTIILVFENVGLIDLPLVSAVLHSEAEATHSRSTIYKKEKYCECHNKIKNRRTIHTHGEIFL